MFRALDFPRCSTPSGLMRRNHDQLHSQILSRHHLSSRPWCRWPGSFWSVQCVFRCSKCWSCSWKGFSDRGIHANFVQDEGWGVSSLQNVCERWGLSEWPALQLQRRLREKKSMSHQQTFEDQTKADRLSSGLWCESSRIGPSALRFQPCFRRPSLSPSRISRTTSTKTSLPKCRHFSSTSTSPSGARKRSGAMCTESCRKFGSSCGHLHLAGNHF